MRPPRVSRTLLDRRESPEGGVVVEQPPGQNEALSQIVGLGKTPQAWVWNAMVLRRSSEVLSRVAADGDERHIQLAFRDPPPPPGEVRERSATPDEVLALVDSYARGVSLMLLASSVECLLKAKLVSNGVEVIGRDGTLHEKFGTHNLRRLATDAGLRLTEARLRILDGLRAFLEWRGRYPIPKGWERLRELERLELGSISEFEENALDLANELRRLFDCP